MKTALRVILFLLGGAVLLLAAAALILPRLVDPNMYRERIAALVEERTGRRLTIDGDIGWSVFPWLGVELNDVQLANPPGFGAEPFARIAALQVRVKLLPLLAREVEMSTLLLDGLQLHLVRGPDGRNNWSGLLPAHGAAGSRAGDRERGAAPPPSAPAAFAVGGVQLRDARLVWEDRTTGAQYVLERINLQTDPLRGTQPVGVALDFNARSNRPAVDATVRLRTQVVPSAAYTQFELRDLQVNVAARGAALPGGELSADLGARLSYASDRRSLAIDDLVLSALDVSMRGQARASGLGAATPRVEGSLSVAEFAPRELLEKLDITPPAGSDPQTLQRARAELEFVLGANAAELRKLVLHVDDSILSGTLGVDNFARPATRFQLALDRIDLDRYLPARDRAAAAPAGPPAAAAGEPDDATVRPAPLPPLQSLRKLRLDGTLRVGELKAYGLRSQAVEVTVAATDGRVRLAPARAQLYEGRYDGNIVLDARGAQPQYALDERLSGVQIGPLLTDLQGTARITGKADIALKLTAAGSESQAIRRSMNGSARFALADGVIKGMDVLGEIRKAYAVLRGRAPAQTRAETEFSALTGTATVVDGVLDNRDLHGRSPLLQIQGAGTANLVTDALDYRVTATLVDALEGQGELTGRPIPVRITGSLAKPKIGVDLQQVLEQEVRKQVEKKIQERLQDKLEGGLKGLLGR